MKLDFSEQAQRLTELDISRNDLVMVESDTFENLKSLKKVNMSFNHIETINWCFRKTDNLEEIYLNNNKLTVIHKDELDNLKKIRILDLAFNLLTSIDNNMYFFNLQELHLNGNKLTSIIV
ncbi:protein phosphatase 1 regulatory subunit pprA-like [Tenebrio molitor]|uniref:protein phosphatase 1 regulatory subunit pprA-like n=1 Tax=Tenebrio molitor TaxID=7067 RepID=UPI0036247C3F